MSSAPVYTEPVFLYAYVPRRLNTTTWDAKRIRSDMNGPPNVEPKSTSAQSYVEEERNVLHEYDDEYSSHHHQRFPPPGTPEAASSFDNVALQREDAIILLLLRMNKSANSGRYTQNCPIIVRSNVLKNGHMNLKSRRKYLTIRYGDCKIQTEISPHLFPTTVLCA